MTTRHRSISAHVRDAVVSIAVVAAIAWPVASAAQTTSAAEQARAAQAAADRARSAQLSAEVAQALKSAQAAKVDTDALKLEVQAELAASLAGARVTGDFDALRAQELAFEMQQRGTGIGQGVGSASRSYSTVAFYSSLDGSYDAGLSLIDSEQWDRAIEMFDRVIKAGKTRVDGAMYWKAYALNRVGKRTEALAVLQEMEKANPNSRWLDDAKALEIEVKQNAGQPVRPEDQANEDLKLLAINSLMQSDPERAIPMLQSVLKSQNSLKVKERALFVLAQNDSPQARDVVAQVARGGANPDLQMKALRYLGIYGRSNAQTLQMLGDIYLGSKDPDVKREILRSLAMAGDVDRLAVIARGETSPDLRIEAIRELGTRLVVRSDARIAVLPGGGWTATAPAVASQPFIVAGDRTVSNREAPKVDTKVITDTLVQIYRSDKDPGVRKQVISTLAMNKDATTLVALARGESDPLMKKEIVSHLSTMKSKEATDYMLELLK